MPTLIINATRHGQQDVPDGVQAMAHAKLAASWRYDTIRVEKPGHSTEYRVEDLLRRLASRWAPHVIANQPWAEHRRLGATVDDHNPNWRGFRHSPPGPIYNPGR